MVETQIALKDDTSLCCLCLLRFPAEHVIAQLAWVLSTIVTSQLLERVSASHIKLFKDVTLHVRVVPTAIPSHISMMSS